MQTLDLALPNTTPENTSTSKTTIVCTVSSDGKIHIYDMANVPETIKGAAQELAMIQPLVAYDTKGTRLTCVTLADGEIPSGSGVKVNGKRKRTQKDVQESEGDDEDDGGIVSEDDDEDVHAGSEEDEDEEEDELEEEGEQEDEDEGEEESD